MKPHPLLIAGLWAALNVSAFAETRTWRGEPLESYEVIVSLIGATRTTTGLDVHATLDNSDYKKGIKVSKADFAALNIEPSTFHGDWNYVIKPRKISTSR